jgi:branched-chain amino acid transport system ATP-binding protein
VSYGGIQAVKGVDFEVHEGELVSLIGSNGAGKTTTMKAITGTLPINAGDIEYLGKSIKGQGPWDLVKQGLAMVPEGRGVFTRMTIIENLQMGAYIRNDADGIAADMEKMFTIFPRLRERKDQLAGTMSGGEQQMLAMGRALMSRPKVLLLDEPSMGLSPIMVDKIFEVVKDVYAQGVTVLLVEQNASRALSIANRGYVMERISALNRHILALLFVTLVWGATFPVLKLATATLSGVEISALRFLIAAVCMVPWAWSAPRRTWRDGGVLGAMVLVSYVAQAYGLEFISSNRSAFLTSLNVLMVPLLGIAFLRQRLSWAVLLAACLACVGIGLMSWDGGAHFLADCATVVGALAYAIYVILLSKRAANHSARQLAATQIVWMAALGCLWMLLSAHGTDTLQTLPSRVSWPVVLGLVYLGVVATSLMLFIQAVAQQHVAAEKAALVYAMEPVFAALFAWFWLGEALSLMAASGAALVVIAVVSSEWWSASK